MNNGPSGHSRNEVLVADAFLLCPRDLGQSLCLVLYRCGLRLSVNYTEGRLVQSTRVEEQGSEETACGLVKFSVYQERQGGEWTVAVDPHLVDGSPGLELVDYPHTSPPFPDSQSSTGICIREKWELHPAEACAPGTFLPKASDEGQELFLTNCRGPTLEDPESTILNLVRRHKDGWFCSLRSPLDFLLVCFYNIYWGGFCFFSPDYKIRTCSWKES